MKFAAPWLESPNTPNQASPCDPRSAATFSGDFPTASCITPRMKTSSSLRSCTIVGNPNIGLTVSEALNRDDSSEQRPHLKTPNSSSALYPLSRDSREDYSEQRAGRCADTPHRVRTVEIGSYV